MDKIGLVTITFNSADPVESFISTTVQTSVGIMPVSGSSITMQSNKKDFDDFVFDGTVDKFKYLVSPIQYTANDWAIIDTSRSSYNVSSAVLFPDLSDAEQASGNLTIDVLSNGFKLRATSTNTAGGNYIYACFASNPFKNSNAV